MKIFLLDQGLGNEPTKDYIKRILEDEEVIEFRIIVAFATLDGLYNLGTFEDQPLYNFISKSQNRFECLVGVDSVTTPFALKEILRLEKEASSGFEARIFSTSERKLFHPKIYMFKKSDGSFTIIIGSSNLTEGGLFKNIEASVMIEDMTEEESNVFHNLWKNVWNHKDTSALTLEAIEKATVRYKSERRNRLKGTTNVETSFEENEGAQQIDPKQVLVRFVPLAGARTSQVHFTKDIIEKFFNISLDKGSKISLQEVDKDGNPHEAESRKLVYAKRNKNPKIEMNGVKRISSDKLSAENRPIVVIQRNGEDSYRYVVLLEGDVGYDPMANALDKLPRIGKSLPYWITDVNSIVMEWEDYPI